MNGLTTATAIWVSAALGVSSGAGLHLLTLIGAALAVCVLRVGRFTRLIRLRRRDFRSFTKAQSDRLKSMVKPQDLSLQQQPVVVGGFSPLQPAVAGGAPLPPQAAASSPQPQSLLKSKNKPPTSSPARQQHQQHMEGDEGEDLYVGKPFGKSKIGLGVPPPPELFENTAAGGLGSQQVDFGDAGSGGMGGSDMPMMISSSGGGDGEGSCGFGEPAGADGAASMIAFDAGGA